MKNIRPNNAEDPKIAIKATQTSTTSQQNPKQKFVNRESWDFCLKYYFFTELK